MIRLRRCDPVTEIDALTKLVSVCFEKPEAYTRSTLLWKYQDAVSFCAAAVTDTSSYAAFYSNRKHDLGCGCEVIPATLCLDMCTHPEYRGQGLVSQTSALVYPEVVQAGAALSYGFSNEQGVKVDKNARKYGYRVVGQIQSYTLAPRSWSKGTFEVLEAVPREIRHDLPLLHVAKAGAAIGWRYQQKPGARYRLIRAQEGAGSMAVIQCRGRQCHIVDLVGSFESAEALAEFLRQVVGYCFATYRRLVSISVLPNQWWQQVTRQRGILVIGSRPAPYYLTVKPHGLPLPADPLDADAWWVVGGDIL